MKFRRNIGETCGERDRRAFCQRFVKVHAQLYSHHFSFPAYRGFRGSIWPFRMQLFPSVTFVTVSTLGSVLVIAAFTAKKEGGVCVL